MDNLPIVKRGRGAPSKKTPEICEAICDGIAQGKSARTMCVEIGIAQPTLWKWLNDDEQFAKHYARAKELGHDLLAEEILQIADETQNDWLEREDGTRYIDNEAVQRSRLRVDARKWYLSKLSPKKYGDKLHATLEGGDPDKPINQNITIAFIPGNQPK